jgi:hypothetical protein
MPGRGHDRFRLTRTVLEEHMKIEITPYSAARIKFLQDSLQMQDPTTLGLSEGMRRSLLTHRLTEAFESGFNARDKLASPGVPAGAAAASDTLMRQLEAAGATGADLSPGDPLCAAAAKRIRELEGKLRRPVTEREAPHCPTCECGLGIGSSAVDSQAAAGDRA